MDICDRSRTAGGAKYPDLSSIGHLPLGSVSSSDLSQVHRYSPQMEINSVLTFSDQSPTLTLPVSSQQEKIKGYIVMNTAGGSSVPSSLSVLAQQHSHLDNNIQLLGLQDSDKSVKLLPVSMTSQISPSVSILPKADPGLRLVSDLQPCITTLTPVTSQQLVCLAGLPSVSSQQITCITNLPTPVTTQMTGLSSVGSLDCLTSSSHQTSTIITAGYDSYTSTMIHPKKKRRLLTFLTEDNNVEALCSGTKPEQGILVNQSQPSKSDTYILTSTCPSLVAVSSTSPTIILNSSEGISSVTKPEQTLFLNPNGTSLVSATKNSVCSTIFLSGGEDGLGGGKETNTDLFLNQTEIGKNEQTLIINSDCTQATLITPVSGSQTTLLASQSQVSFTSKLYRDSICM